jgi:hypothetical protein
MNKRAVQQHLEGLVYTKGMAVKLQVLPELLVSLNPHYTKTVAKREGKRTV